MRLLNHFFYQRPWFLARNANDYYDPDNSYLNVVLKQAAASSDLAGGALYGVGQYYRPAALAGVSFPNHFLVRMTIPPARWWWTRSPARRLLEGAVAGDARPAPGARGHRRPQRGAAGPVPAGGEPPRDRGARCCAISSRSICRNRAGSACWRYRTAW
ncbi:transglutaminase family protein [Cupriavidus basilensis]